MYGVGRLLTSISRGVKTVRAPWDRNIATKDYADANPFSLVDRDVKAVNEQVEELLQHHLNHKDMFDIAVSYNKGIDNNCTYYAAGIALVAKAVNYHLFKDGLLTIPQLKVMALSYIMNSMFVLRDDIYDNVNNRKGLPSAHVKWDPYRVTMTANAMTALCVLESVKLESNIVSLICQMNEVVARGQLQPFRDDSLQGDLFGNYLEKADWKCGSLVAQACTTVVRPVTSSVLLEDTVWRFGYSLGMACALMDDMRDLRGDLEVGMATAPVLLALKEHPVLEDMVRRKFQEKEDVERTLEIVERSRGMEETRNIVERYLLNSRQYLRYLADSPYTAALNTVFDLVLINSSTDIEDQPVSLAG